MRFKVFGLLLALLLAGCEVDHNTKPGVPMFRVGSLVRHKVSGQTGMVLRRYNNGEYRIRFRVENIVTTNGVVTSKTISLDEQDDVAYFELEEVKP